MGRKGRKLERPEIYFYSDANPLSSYSSWHVLTAGHQVNTPDRATEQSWQQSWCCLAMVTPSHLLSSTSELAVPACFVPEPQIHVILWGGTRQRLGSAAAPGQCRAPYQAEYISPTQFSSEESISAIAEMFLWQI